MKVELQDTDAALVFSGNCLNLIIPNEDGDAEVPQHVFFASALAACLVGDASKREQILNIVESFIDEREAELKEEE